MKHIVLAAVLAGLAAVGAAGVPGSAAAQEAGISTTLSARHWDHGRHYGWYRGHHRGWRNHYAAAGCRVVVRSHINRWGERVFVRRRVCF
jgi:Ni/Co efflux regulator RcnB